MVIRETPYFEIQPEIEYTQAPLEFMPIDTPLYVIQKHIPQQSDIDKIVKSIES